MTIRVPAAAFDDALRDLRRLGKVESESIKGEDVGGQLALGVVALGNVFLGDRLASRAAGAAGANF